MGDRIIVGYWRKFCILAVICLMSLTPAHAQTSRDQAITPPDFSVESLTAERDRLINDDSLTPEQNKLAVDYYDVARKALTDAATLTERAQSIRRELESSPRTIERLRSQINAIESEPIDTPDNNGNGITDETLLRLQQQLITEEGELRRIQAEINSLEDTQQAMLQQPYRQNLADARARLSDVTTELETFGENELQTVARARKTSLQARQYYRRVQIDLLETEISSLSTRQQILSLRRNLAILQAQRAEANVTRLQDRTGLRRLSEARETIAEAEQMMMMLEGAHPFVIHYGVENVALSERLRSIATEAGATTKQQANARTRRDQVKNDLTIAQRLTDRSSINRQSSTILRRLRNQRPSVNSIKLELNDTRDAINSATQDQLWAQEQLRQLPLGNFDVESLARDWREENTGYPPLAATDEDLLRALNAKRRELLTEISDAAFALIAEADQLESIETELLTHTTNLRDLLDQKLLWLPSMSAVDLDWPGKILRGIGSVFGPEKISRAAQVFVSQFQRMFLVVLLFFAAIGVALVTRRNLRADIIDRAKKVGRVQKDTYWHTPFVIIACGIIAAPIPLLLLLIGILFMSSSSADPFIAALGQTGIELSGFTLFFMTWREWNRDHSLMDKHLKLASSIRRRVIRHLGWFIPFAGVSIAIVTLTQNSREPDVYEGVSLLAFIVTAFSLSYFGFQILWAKRGAFGNALSESSFLWRHRRTITILIVGLPVIAAGLAAAGYYDTARELLSRLFFSSGLVIGTYVIYGLIRRTVVVAQRRIALRRAIERREKAIKAREEKEKAEERGNPTPPPTVNYEEIDLETLSRQSTQLLNTFVVIGFAVLMWFFWQDLLPALSIFDEVQFWEHTVRNGSGESITEAITLWNVMQALAIAAITIIAAKNLPGFLEVFILNRSRFDTGTRYAIVSVVGYIIIAIGLVIAFNKLGTEWSQLQWIVAALGVGIGFGLQEIIANFISGLIILFERPVRLGDYVTIGNESGTVNRIQIRATTLTDLDNREILIPNKELITTRVMNWTLSNATVRMTIRVGIAYGSDTDAARNIMLKVVQQNKTVLEQPPPQVFFLGFGDSSLDFEVRVFIRSFEDRFPTSHAIHTEINKELEKAGITIPFPQRDLHIMTAPAELNVKRDKPQTPRKKPAAKKT